MINITEDLWVKVIHATDALIQHEKRGRQKFCRRQTQAKPVFSPTWEQSGPTPVCESEVEGSTR